MDAQRGAGLMMTRNRLAAHKARGAWALPPPLKDMHSCGSCMMLPLCAVAHHAMEGGSAQTFGLEQQYNQLTEHLSERGSRFLRHWLHLLEAEQAECRIPQSRIWALDPPPPGMHAARGTKRPRNADVNRHESENISPNSQSTSDPGVHQPAAKPLTTREATIDLSEDVEVQHPLAGRCIGSLMIWRYEGDCSNVSLYPFAYTFTQSQEAVDSSTVQENKPLSSQGFAVGDCGILSVQDRHVAVNRARVMSVSTTELKLALRSRISPALAEAPGSRMVSEAASLCEGTRLRWRLDKDEPETAFQCTVSGLLELMVTQSAHAERLRGLIVNHDAPCHSARDNYDNEVPLEEDGLDGMLDSEYVSVPLLCAMHACSSASQHNMYSTRNTLFEFDSFPYSLAMPNTG